MPKKKRLRIAFVLRTIGLEYDDRVRKEILALSDRAEVKIFAHFSDNRSESGITGYGTPYESIVLQSRKILPSSKLLLVKAFEFYARTKKHLKNYDIVWAHEEYAFMFPLLLGDRKCIWDLHEIPFHFEKQPLKSVFRRIEKKCKLLIHANDYRIKHLIQSGLIADESKHVSLNNYPDAKFSNSDAQDGNYKDFLAWLEDSQYVYIQGVSNNRRYPYNTLKSVLSTSNLKAVIVGGIEKEAYRRLEYEYGNELKQKLFFTGKVDQLKIPAYLKSASFSIVLYDTLTPNNRFCEPNRLYQSILMNVPVIVGHNEPMKDLVLTNSFGIVLNSDGNDLGELVEAIDKMKNQRQQFSESIIANNSIIQWKHENILDDWLN